VKVLLRRYYSVMCSSQFVFVVFRQKTANGLPKRDWGSNVFSSDLISGGGEIIEPDDDVLAIGSGGNFALAAARAFKRHGSGMEAKDMAREALEVASERGVYTNNQIIVEEL
ncbi:hypothetical protein E4V51_26905, partial [Paenibacillus sp. 28ISP30-2]|nr:hypothetical protein [Paenibacillus sp. 28ISP30-2]